MTKQTLRKRTRNGLLQLKPYLDSINKKVEVPDFIASDPVQFMYAFSEKKDIEIAGFLASLMAWGRRDIVVSKVNDLLNRMDYSPYQFIMAYDQKRFSKLNGFKHRTFKPIDIHGIFCTLGEIYRKYKDFEHFWRFCYQTARDTNRPLLSCFQENFFTMSLELQNRTLKHVSNPDMGSTCKRLNMYLRWTIRKNSHVDTGIWKFMDASELMIPFDVHVARQARIYGLISRKTNDWKSVQELTDSLRVIDSDDPVRYDFALFGMGALGFKLPHKFILNRI